MKLYAPAKINLHLEVLNRRPDGYHNLRSLFVKTALYDSLDVCIKEDSSVYSLECETFSQQLPLEKDLLFRAAELYKTLSGCRFGLQVKLTKAIPQQAGLGGGSADAGVLLRYLDAYFGVVGTKTLITAAATVGADVPFFVSPVAAAVIEGVGEKIFPVKGERVFVVLAKPTVGIPTPQAFAALQRGSDYRERIERSLLERLWNEGSKEVRSVFFNSFEEVFEQEYSFIRSYKEKLYAEGAFYAGLSGSGSTIVGLFIKARQAEAACRRLQNEAVFLAGTTTLTEDSW